jgi:3-dehydroquinate dehydratase
MAKDAKQTELVTVKAIRALATGGALIKVGQTGKISRALAESYGPKFCTIVEEEKPAAPPA